MSGTEVALAALAITASIAAALVWLLKKLFNQNDTTLRENNKVLSKLAVVIDGLENSLSQRDIEQRKFQQLVITSFATQAQTLKSISDKTDRNYNAVSNITIKNQTVEHQLVQSEVVEEKTHDQDA